MQFLVVLIMQTHSPSVQMELTVPTPPYVSTEEECNKYAKTIGEMYIQQGQATYLISSECVVTKWRNT